MSFPRSILVYVGRDLVGDGVMKLPFLRALRHAFPQAHVTWLAGQGKTVFAGSLAPLVTGLLDEVIEEAGVGGSVGEFLRRPLSGRRFDLVLDSQRRVLTSLILRRIRHGLFLSAAADWRLSDRRPAAGWQKPPAMIGQMLELVELASGRPACPEAPLLLDDRLIEEAASRLPPGPVYVGLAPGAGGKHKCWPLDNFIALALRQSQAGRVPVVFLGPDEAAWEDELRDALPLALFPLDHLATPPLTIALGRNLAAAVANDSGTGHMLAASGVPLISLFGPTSPDKFAPYTGRLTIIRAQTYGGDEMAALPLEPVVEAVDRALLEPA